MSDINLQNIDVDKLFEQHNVAEIAQTHKILQKEIEEKKEEIRVMVGERYRDLIQAADTINDMQNTSGLLLEQIKTVSNNCQRLNETQLFGFKTENQLNINIEKNLKLYFSTNIRIRILTILPDLVWSRIDTNEYFIAAQIHIFAEHIISSLKLESDNPFLNYFPVTKKIFGLIELAGDSLRQSVIKSLENDNLNAEDATDCILCLYLLDQTNLEKLLSSFLERRVVAYKRSLLHQDTDKRVKDRILSSLTVLVSTVDLVNKCFFNNNQNDESLLIKNIKEYRNSDQQATILYIDFDKNEWISFLPDNIKNFRPSIADPKLEDSAVKVCYLSWLKMISDISSTELRNLFELITSMKVIQDVKKDALNLENDPQWSKKLQLFQITPAVDFYKETYIPLINKRVMNIITHSWIKCTQSTYEKINSALNEPKKLGEYEYLWLEDRSDLPTSLNDAFKQDKKNNRYLMKMKGYNHEIVSICEFFDHSLNEIFTETKLLLDEANSNKKNDDDNSLIDFLKSITESQISDLITKLKLFIVDKNLKSIVFVAKFLSGLTELCPNLKECLTFTSINSNSREWSTNASDKKNFQRWTIVCNLIEEESFSMWKKFCDLLFIEFVEKNQLNENLSYKTILEDFVNWETMVIEEKDEQDNTVSSSIRIPSQPRISIHKILFELIKILNDLIPHTLPLSVLRYLIEKLTIHFIEHYNKLLKCKFSSTNQNMALQLFFDLKFLQTVFTSRENKKLTDDFQKLLNTIKNYIDPFDFELFHLYLLNNVKKCICKMQHHIGILLPYPDNINALITDFKGSSNLIEKDPNVLILSSSAATATWFPLLPVVMDNKPDIAAQIEIEKASTTNPPPSSLANEVTDAETKQTPQNYSINVKSGAAAFFGAMSQDWFR